MNKNLYDTLADRWCNNGTVWIYSDPHFNDNETKALRQDYIGDDSQVKRINSVVGKNDTIIFLGDIGDLNFIKRIRGYKVLIMGNHEKGASNYKKQVYSDVKFCNEFPKDFIPEKHGYKVVDPTPFGNLYAKITDNGLFDEVYEGPIMVNDRLILSHEPIEGLPKYMFNIHGHDHSNWYRSDNSMNVCAEHINYTPVNLLSLLKNGLLKDTLSIHRVTINSANKRKQKRNIKNVEKMIKDMKHD